MPIQPSEQGATRGVLNSNYLINQSLGNASSEAHETILVQIGVIGWVFAMDDSCFIKNSRHEVSFSMSAFFREDPTSPTFCGVGEAR
jgi:hypothetical protein